MLIRPEQCMLSTSGPQVYNAVTAGSDCHGHDAITEVILDGRPEPAMVVRVRGTDVIGPGRRVTLTVTDPVHAWAGVTCSPASPPRKNVLQARGLQPVLINDLLA